MRENRRDLERAHQAHARDARRRRAGNLAPVEEDLAARGLEKVREQVEASRLAGAVGADQGMDRPAPHLQRDPVDGDEAFEFLRQAARFKDYRSVHSVPAGRGILP